MVSRLDKLLKIKIPTFVPRIIYESVALTKYCDRVGTNDASVEYNQISLPYKI